MSREINTKNFRFARRTTQSCLFCYSLTAFVQKFRIKRTRAVSVLKFIYIYNKKITHHACQMTTLIEKLCQQPVVPVSVC